MPFPTITPLPPAPSRSDLPTVFIPKADAFVASLANFQSELNIAGSYVADISVQITQAAANAATASTNAAASAQAAAASALTAVNAPGTKAASVTNMTIATGAQPFTMTAGKAFGLGQTVVIASRASPTNRMIGPLTAYNSVNGISSVLVDTIFGSGSASDWEISLSAPGSIPVATAADIWAGTDNGKAITAAAQAAADLFQTLTDNPTIAWNAATQGHNAKVVLGGNRAMGLPSGLRAGRTYTLHIYQDATGGRTITFPANFKFGQAGAPVLSTGANNYDVVRFQLLDTTGPILDAQFKKIGS